jgi:two-component system, OmpR family, sensor histidine kinase KdpD
MSSNSTSPSTKPAANLHLAMPAPGKLKVFLGMCPGVGKTYAMLQAGGELARHGVDVIAAVIETHGRKETAALLDGLELLPRKEVTYRDTRFEELDLDALLTRRPKVALVDELAHTNAPGSRHPKRWQDIAEILDAGIDVFTTVNIQHLESRADIVSSITRAPVRETVPDSFLERADEIELIDLTPRDLHRRLGRGKGLSRRARRRRI